MKAKNTKEAWKIVDELFPTDYAEDPAASAKAGYKVFRSTLPGCPAWISDLGDRLEVNTEEGSVNVWIDEEEATEEAEGFTVAPIYTPSVAVTVAITVTGGTLAQNAAEQAAYDRMKRGDNSPAFEALERYAKAAGLKWGTMRLERVTHFDHHKHGEGHFIIQGIITPPVEDPFCFLPFCADLLAEAYKENNGR